MTEKRTKSVYSEELKAAALADVVLLGTGATAAKYAIPTSTLKDWQRAFSVVYDPSLKKERIELIAASYLEATLQALASQAYVASQPDYIERQPADGLAILHGVMADKAIRLLEALYNGGRRGRRPELEADSQT